MMNTAYVIQCLVCSEVGGIANYTSKYRGAELKFCCGKCKDIFDKRPEDYI